MTPSLQSYLPVFQRAVPHKMCSSKKICIVLVKNVYYFVVQGCEKVIISKNDRSRYEMIGETQTEMELFEVVTFIYPLSLKAGSSIPSATGI